MAEIEKVSEADRLEQANLERVVADVERTLLASPPGTRPFFNGFLMNAKARLGVLDKKIHDEEREKEQQKSNEVAIVQLAEKESALNSKEKEEYSGFLKEDFFTKKDFARLDHFYAHSWDRLSEDGKDQMSRRIWEGVRRDEYKFADLSKDIQEKEESRAYKLLSVSPKQSANVMRIPQKDKNDFIRAYESGNREEAGKILNKDTFKENMFHGNGSEPIVHTAAKADSVAVVAQAKTSVAAQPGNSAKPAPDSLGNVDFSGINLGAMKPADNASQGLVANLPRSPNGASRQC